MARAFGHNRNTAQNGAAVALALSLLGAFIVPDSALADNSNCPATLPANTYGDASGNPALQVSYGGTYVACGTSYVGNNTIVATGAGTLLTFTAPTVSITSPSGNVYTLAVGTRNAGTMPIAPGATVQINGNVNVLGTLSNSSGSRTVIINGNTSHLAVDGNLNIDARNSGYSIQSLDGDIYVGGTTVITGRNAYGYLGTGTGTFVGNTTITTTGGRSAINFQGGYLDFQTQTDLTTSASDTVIISGGTISLGGAHRAKDPADVLVDVGADATITANGASNNGITISNAAASTALNVDVSGTVKAGASAILSNSIAGQTANITLRNGSDLSSTTLGTIVTDTAGNATVRVNNGATLAGGFSLGAGSDTLIFDNFSTLSSITAIDMGDDLSSADGMVDTVTFSGMTGSYDGSLIRNAENVVLDQASVFGFTNGSLTVGSDPGLGLTITGGSRLDAAAAFDLTGNMIVAGSGIFDATGGGAGAYSVSGALSNAGLVTTQDDQTGDVITVSGDYVGGGTLRIDTVLGGDASATDMLVLRAGTSGQTMLVVGNVGGAGAATTTGILVVKTGDFTGSFALQGGPISVGNYTYDLQQGAEGWYLVSKINSPTGIYEALPSILFPKLPTLEQRLGQRQWLGDSGASANADEPGRGTWVRIWGDKQDLRPEGSTSGVVGNRRDWGVQLGFDHPLDAGDNGQWVLGLTGQYGRSTANIRLDDGFGTIEADGLSLGVTATWYGDNGVYADLQGQISRLNTDVEGNGTTQMLDGRGFTVHGLSAELGWRKAISDQAALVPQVQLRWSHVSGGRFTDNLNAQVDLGSPSQLIGRIGLAYEYTSSNGEVFGNKLTPGEGSRHQKLYVIGNLLHDFSDETNVTVGDVVLHQRDARTWAEVGFGGTVSWDENKTFYTEVAYRRALNGDAAEGLTATAGFSLRF